MPARKYVTPFTCPPPVFIVCGCERQPSLTSLCCFPRILCETSTSKMATSADASVTSVDSWWCRRLNPRFLCACTGICIHICGVRLTRVMVLMSIAMNKYCVSDVYSSELGRRTLSLIHSLMMLCFSVKSPGLGEKHVSRLFEWKA